MPTSPLARGAGPAGAPMMDDPRIRSPAWRPRIGFAYTFETLRFLSSAYPEVRFVWIMGADNLSQFDRWERWRELRELMPIAVYARPARPSGDSLQGRDCACSQSRLPDRRGRAAGAARSRPPGFTCHGLTFTLILNRNPGRPQGSGELIDSRNLAAEPAKRAYRLAVRDCHHDWNDGNSSAFQASTPFNQGPPETA